MIGKKAVSELIGVVLMISMAIVMAGMVYGFMKFYVQKPIPEDLCPDGVSIIISDYKCLENSMMINITFKNQGRFDINQVLIKINNESGKPAVYPLFEMKLQDGEFIEIPFIYVPFSEALFSGEEETKTFSYEKYSKIEIIEIEPTKGTDKYGRPILCQKAITTIPVKCPSVTP